MRTIGTPSTQARKLNAIASGALPNGKPVIVNADGTVSVPAVAFGSSTVFESASAGFISATYDANSQKVVIAYTDNGNSSHGTAIVGTVSGTSISFGTPVVFESAATTYNSITYDANAQKVVIFYRDQGNSSYGTAKVGTVSGTSISFGSATVFRTANVYFISSAYDSNSQKIVVAYSDNGNSSYGTAVVGTVSGTSISFGSTVVFNSAYVDQSRITYDSTAQRFVIVYRDGGNSYYSTAIVGTVSGTSISFGSSVVVESAGFSNLFGIVYDSNAQKVVIAYTNGNNSNYGTAKVGTVSGTTISFGASVVFESALASSMSATYDSTSQKVLIAYKDAGNSNYGTAVVGTVSGTSISFGTPVVFLNSRADLVNITYDANAQKAVISYADNANSLYGNSLVYESSASAFLTSENYIGLSSNGYPDTAGATIDVQGAINDRQSGLTAGQAYYVQTDGTLTTTAGDPSVFAGTAISATKMIVKG